jgi:hypothetical protein
MVKKSLDFIIMSHEVVMACKPEQPVPIPLEPDANINWLHLTNRHNHNTTSHPIFLYGGYN